MENIRNPNGTFAKSFLTPERARELAEIRWGNYQEGKKLHQESPPSRFVYAVDCGEYTKIGQSGSPHKRLSGIKSANPLDITFVMISEAGEHAAEIEKALKNKYAPCHHRGEWFALNESGKTQLVEDLELVALMKTPEEHDLLVQLFSQETCPAD